jgi:hypothetical protein
VSIAEHPLDDSEELFYWGSLPVNAPVHEPIPDTHRMAPHRLPHGGIVASGLNAEVPTSMVDYLPWPVEGYIAVVQAFRSRLQLADQARSLSAFVCSLNPKLDLPPFLAHEPLLLLLVFASSTPRF